MGAASRAVDLAGYALIKIKRVYDPPTPDDGLRFLVDRLWPRGVENDALNIAGWLKAPLGAAYYRNTQRSRCLFSLQRR